MVWYSQEAREYMLVAAFCGASLLCFLRAWRDPSGRNLAWWALFSVLALLTHYFAAFLIAPEALWLLYNARSRASVVAVTAVGVVELALIPLLVNHATASLLGFITGTHLSTRIQEVPVAFALGPTFETSLMRYGLIGAAVLAGVLIVLLIVGGETDELRGAGVAAALAAVVVLAPLIVALLGKDYYLERALIPAWLPLSIVLAAACTTRRLRVPGAVLAGIVLAGFAYGAIRIATDRQYQRPDWRAVAHALGSASGPRAIVAYDDLATDPLKLYLPRVAWTNPAAPVAVSEVDVVGYPLQTVADRLPAGVRLLSTRRVEDFLIFRFSIERPQPMPADQIGSRAERLLANGPPGQVVLLQSSRSAG
jgi:hypothetical protein